MTITRLASFSLLVGAALAAPLSAKEGMYTPDQLQEISGQLEDATKGDELPAAPGARVYVTTEVTDVTEAMREGTEGMEPLARYELVQQRRKDIIAGCEETAGYRCQVSGFYGGAQYKLIKRLEVRDVRLVYAPADSIGKYGGDIDNWQWPRHTGDFAFYRAYVAPDGSAADFSEDNVPYAPEHHLKVSAKAVEAADF